jgi:hypothetical protein
MHPPARPPPRARRVEHLPRLACCSTCSSHALSPTHATKLSNRITGLTLRSTIPDPQHHRPRPPRTTVSYCHWEREILLEEGTAKYTHTHRDSTRQHKTTQDNTRQHKTTQDKRKRKHGCW